jgi:hypothetical protein
VVFKRGNPNKESITRGSSGTGGFTVAGSALNFLEEEEKKKLRRETRSKEQFAFLV